MKIPFSPPLINSDVQNEVVDSLQSGWITTGPKVKLLESQIKSLAGCPEVLCVNSWTSGAILILKWLGVQPGDEVIIPAYTYSATALAVIHAGATPVLVDVADDFNISIGSIKKAITKKTKAIIPVDIAGWPCDYDEIKTIVEESRNIFEPNGDIQKKLGRILIISDAAHSIGATYKNLNTGVLADITIFSLHAVKNVTTAEGGAICLNMPASFNNKELYGILRCYSLNGQTKDAFSKSKAGAWRYDIIYPGLKINMPDVLAAIGVGQMKSYKNEALVQRFNIFKKYHDMFKSKEWAITPQYLTSDKKSSCHIYALRIKNINEEQRDKIIDLISQKEVAVNVHFQPLPLLTIFKNMGYDIKNFPMAYDQYKNEISLPIYPQLKEVELKFIAEVVSKSVENVIQ